MYGWHQWCVRVSVCPCVSELPSSELNFLHCDKFVWNAKFVKQISICINCCACVCVWWPKTRSSLATITVSIQRCNWVIFVRNNAMQLTYLMILLSIFAWEWLVGFIDENLTIARSLALSFGTKFDGRTFWISFIHPSPRDNFTQSNKIKRKKIYRPSIRKSTIITLIWFQIWCFAFFRFLSPSLSLSLCPFLSFALQFSLCSLLGISVMMFRRCTYIGGIIIKENRSTDDAPEKSLELKKLCMCVC